MKHHYNGCILYYVSQTGWQIFHSSADEFSSDANSWGHLWTAARQGRSQNFISTETKGWTGGLGTEPPVGWTGCLGSAIRGIAPVQGFKGLPPEAFPCEAPWSWKLFCSWIPKGNGKSTIISYFTAYWLFSNNVWSCIYTTVLWWRVIFTRLEMLWLSDNP